MTAALALTLAACDAETTVPVQTACPEQVDTTTPSDETLTPPLAWVECVSTCRLSVTSDTGFTQQVWDPIDPDLNLYNFEFSGEIPVQVRAGLVFEIEVLGVTGDGGVYGGAFLTMDAEDYVFQFDVLGGGVHTSKFISIAPQPGEIETFEVVRYLY